MKLDLKGFFSWVTSGFKQVPTITVARSSGLMPVTLAPPSDATMAQTNAFVQKARNVNQARGVGTTINLNGTASAKAIVTPRGGVTPAPTPDPPAQSPPPDTTAPLIPGGPMVTGNGAPTTSAIAESDNHRFVPGGGWWGHQFGNQFQFPRAATSVQFTLKPGRHLVTATDAAAGLATYPVQLYLNGYGRIQSGQYINVPNGYTGTITAFATGPSGFTVETHGPFATAVYTGKTLFSP